jgi:peptidylprolyl isomerase
VTYFNDFPTIFRSRTSLGLATLAAAVLIAGCGSSGSSSTIGVGQENKGDEALAKSSAPAASTPTTAPTATAKTPTSGPLSTKPSVSVPTGGAPAKLVVKDIIKGTGPAATAAKPVTVNYVGVLFKGGEEFDSSWKTGAPATFSLQGVIPGWTQGIPGMKVGGRRELIIPAALAYGPQGRPPTIPKNAPLVFVIDLLGT